MRLVLLHSPLLGPLTWRAVAERLTDRGHAVEAPAWPRLSTLGEAPYAALAGSLAATLEPCEGAILVAHSGAGALVPALAAAMETPPAGVIFCDAILPHPGASWFDTAPPGLAHQLYAGAEAGHMPAWNRWWPPGALERLVPDAGLLADLVAQLEPIPLTYFEASAPAEKLDLPAAYLQLSGAYEDEARLAGRYGWPLVRLPLHHLAMLTNPEAVAGALETLAARLEPGHG